MDFRGPVVAFPVPLLLEHDITIQYHDPEGVASSGTKIPSVTTTTTTNSELSIMNSKKDNMVDTWYGSGSVSASSSVTSFSTITSSSRSSDELVSTRRPSSEDTRGTLWTSKVVDQTFFMEPMDVELPYDTRSGLADERIGTDDSPFVGKSYDGRPLFPRQAAHDQNRARNPWGIKGPIRTDSAPTKPNGSFEMAGPSHVRPQTVHESHFQRPFDSFLTPTIIITEPSSGGRMDNNDTTSGPNRRPNTIIGHPAHDRLAVTNAPYKTKSRNQTDYLRSNHVMEMDSDEEDNLSLSEIKRMLTESRRTRFMHATAGINL